jgi:hypothetical protein
VHQEDITNKLFSTAGFEKEYCIFPELQKRRGKHVPLRIALAEWTTILLQIQRLSDVRNSSRAIRVKVSILRLLCVCHTQLPTPIPFGAIVVPTQVPTSEVKRSLQTLFRGIARSDTLASLGVERMLDDPFEARALLCSKMKFLFRTCYHLAKCVKPRVGYGGSP